MRGGLLAAVLPIVAAAAALAGGSPGVVDAQPAAAAAGTAAAAQSASPSAQQNPVTPAAAQQLIETLQDPQKRAALIRNLQAIAKGMPPGATIASPAGAKPTTPAPEKGAVRLAPHSLGAQVMAALSRWAGRLTGDASTAAQTVTAFPQLWQWAIGGGAEAMGRRRVVMNEAGRAAAVIGVALLLEFLVRLAAARASAILVQRAPPLADTEAAPATEAEWRLLRRLPFALARLGLELVPIGVFWAAGVLLSGFAARGVTQAALVIIIDAYAMSRAILAAGGAFASPTSGRLRLLHLDDQEAASVVRWLRGVTVFAAAGGAIVSLAGLFGLNDQTGQTLGRLVALIVAILIGIAVLRARAGVAQLLRSDPAATGELAGLRNGFAVIWHHLALVLIVASWILWDAGTANGLDAIRLLLGSIAIVIAARFAAIVALGALDRAFGLGLALSGGGGARASRYHPAARFTLAGLIVAAMIVGLLQFWGADAFSWFRQGTVGARLLSALLTVALAGILAIVVWEVANARFERQLQRLIAAGAAAHAARLRTLLPLLRTALLIAVLAVVGLTALSQIGIDIAPLLAGAGIVGVAVGFGSQKLVQDVITGIFVLFENAIQVGETVTVAGLSGTVEQLSVRNIWLRGGDGTVHIIPFSSVTSISNSNRGIGNAAISVTIPYQDDSERVFAALRAIAAEMRGDATFAPLMLGEPQLWVDVVKAEGVTIAGMIPCTDQGRSATQHEFNRRMQQQFVALGIALSG